MFSGDNWYFRARKRVLTEFIGPCLSPGSRILDIGCGDGWLSVSLPGSEWHGIEPDEELREIAVKRGMNAVSGGAGDLPFPDEFFDAVAMLDVLEHTRDDRKAIKEAMRVLKPGGLLSVSVPLHPELWSGHDTACGHVKRYRKGEVTNALKENVLIVLKQRFFVSLPLPVVFLARKAGSGKTPCLPALLDRTLCKCLIFDARLSLPFGLTEAVIAKKGGI